MISVKDPDRLPQLSAVAPHQHGQFVQAKPQVIVFFCLYSGIGADRADLRVRAIGLINALQNYQRAISLSLSAALMGVGVRLAECHFKADRLRVSRPPPGKRRS